MLKYSYWIGKGGPYCASCAKFIGHIKESEITRNLSRIKPLNSTLCNGGEMNHPISELDRLVRYLINNHGDIVKVDDMSLDNVVDETISAIESLLQIASQQAAEAGAEIECVCDTPSYPLGPCSNCGGLIRTA
uniref:Uncharacterized protein n=2 Tax=viral metagenome TaxID=1070528 RepID=A0A6M3JR09_9ZZZZ